MTKHASKSAAKSGTHVAGDLNVDLDKFVTDAQRQHESRERAKQLQGRDGDVRRRQQRAEKDNETPS